MLFVWCVGAVVGAWLGAEMTKKRIARFSPDTTLEFRTLIVDSEGVSVHATLTVENDDVMTLITGEKWRFQRRMEEQ